MHFVAPLGNRVYKKSTAEGSAVEHKYIVDPQGVLDITGKLPVILLEVNGSGGIVKTHIYGDRQILAQHDGDSSDDKYFYLHDRLGSARQIIKYDDQTQTVQVVKYYTYEPFGEVIDDDGTFDNAFRFTGQYFDPEIEEYYLRARQYNPQIARFTSRDPARGKFTEPLTLHKYLYCNNDPGNRTDPSGEVWGFIESAYARAKNAVACVGAKTWAEEMIIGGASAANAVTQGYINMLFGPDDMSDEAKFWVGFAAGFGEMQIGLRTGRAWLATTAASTFMSAANSAMSDSTGFVSIGTAINIGFSAVMGGVGDWASEGLDVITVWALGVDAAMGSGLIQKAVGLEP